MPIQYSRRFREKRIKKCIICKQIFEIDEKDNISRQICYNPSCIEKFRELCGKGELPKQRKPYKTRSNYDEGLVYVLNEKTWTWEEEERK